MADRMPPDEATTLGYFETLSNWGRWGPDDQLGTMNLVTPEKVRQAAGLVQEGAQVSCARVLTTQNAVDVRQPVSHFMAYSGEEYALHEQQPGELQAASDYIGMVFHGFMITHVDSLSHIFWRGKLYNGRPSHLITTREGATVGSIELLKDGVVSRGVLLDIARLRGVDWVEFGDAIWPDELDAAAQACNVQVGPGDILLIRTGDFKRRLVEGPSALENRTGPQASCLPWFRERDIAMLGSDTANDQIPSGYQDMVRPVHQVGIAGMGLWLIDNCNLEELAAACAQRNRWEFMLTINPLRIQYGTGSPVNPVAVF